MLCVLVGALGLLGASERLLPPSAPPAVAAGQAVFAIDFEKTRHRVTGALRGFQVTDPHTGTLMVKVRGNTLDLPGKSGELVFDLRRSPLSRRPWGNQSLVSADIRVSPEFVDGKRNWARSHRARLFVVDRGGRRLYLPYVSAVDRPARTDGWMRLEGRPTADVPIPLGHIDRGFDPDRVVAVGLNLEAFNRPGEAVSGQIDVRDLKVVFEPATAPNVLPADPAILAGEKARARRMRERLRARCGITDDRMAVGVNLAWPSAVSPEGETLQLYGRILDGGEPWWGQLWDIGTETVARSVREDFRGIRAIFGEKALVRLWLFSDLRAGIAFDKAQNPTTITPRAVQNMGRLLALAQEEEVVLIPVLLDFGMADGLSRLGPDGAWEVGERPELITDSAKRARLVELLVGFVRHFKDHPAILAWDVMNEPGNAAAVVNPRDFGHLQALLRETTLGIQAAGEMATVGYRNIPDTQRFFRGRVPTDLGQVHYYPLVETRKNPTSFAARMRASFGPLPAGWGEAQVLPGFIARQLAQVRRAGHDYLMFWSWRGHEESGDGFAIQPHGEEIKKALLRLGRARAAP